LNNSWTDDVSHDGSIPSLAYSIPEWEVALSQEGNSNYWSLFGTRSMTRNNSITIYNTGTRIVSCWNTDMARVDIIDDMLEIWPDMTEADCIGKFDLCGYKLTFNFNGGGPR